VRPILLRRSLHLSHTISNLICRQYVPRHDDGGEVPLSENLSIFFNPGRPTPKNAMKRRYLSEIEFRQAHNYILFNCNELRPFIT